MSGCGAYPIAGRLCVTGIGKRLESVRDWQRPVSSELFRQSPMFEECFAETGFVETGFY